MGWTEFTSPLAPGDIMRAAQRDELLDAIEERFAAVEAVEFAWAEEMEDIKASRLPTVRAAWTVNDGSPVFGSVAGLVAALAAYFIRGEEEADFVAPNVLVEAAEDEGLDEEEWGEIQAAVGAGVDVAAYWNVVKRAIGLLKRVSRPVQGVSTILNYLSSGSITGEGFEEAAENLVAATPTSSSHSQIQTYLAAFTSGDTVFWNIALRSERLITIPDMATGRVWLYSSAGTLSNVIGLNVGLRIGDVLGSETTQVDEYGGPSLSIKVLVEGVPTGEQLLEWFFLGFEDVSELDPALATTFGSCFQTPVTALGIELQFDRE